MNRVKDQFLDIPIALLHEFPVSGLQGMLLTPLMWHWPRFLLSVIWDHIFFNISKIIICKGYVMKKAACNILLIEVLCFLGKVDKGAY